jgi:ribosome-associated toxin RatA of RatAB toxin-antitoxin module
MKEKHVPEVQAETLIQAPPETVYQLAKDIERFPEFLPNVQEVKITERDGGRVVSSWVGLVPEFKRTLKWTEEDVWDDAAHTCIFRLISGDWDQYDGTWSFTPEGSGTRVRMTITYEYNVPLIGALIKQLLRKLVQRNVEETLAGLKQQAERGE